MTEIKHRRFLREKDATRLLEESAQKLKVNINELLKQKKMNIEVAETPNATVFFLNGKPLMARIKEVLVPTLLFEQALNVLPRVTVNMGAVPHVCNGADVLAPGIVKVEGEFRAGDYVLVVDERHRKPLAVTLALIDSQSAQGLNRGKVSKNVHYVGDDVWNLIKSWM